MFSLSSGVAAAIIHAELAEVPWVVFWWSQVLRCIQSLAKLDLGSLHARLLLDNVHDARADPLCGNWAAGIQKQYSTLGMLSPFGGQGIRAVDAPIFRQKFAHDHSRVWAHLHVLARTAPSARAKYCTYLHWFFRPGKMLAEPYFYLLDFFQEAQDADAFQIGVP